MKEQDTLSKIIVTPLDRLRDTGILMAKCQRLLQEGYSMITEQDTMNWIFIKTKPNPDAQ